MKDEPLDHAFNFPSFIAFLTGATASESVCIAPGKASKRIVRPLAEMLRYVDANPDIWNSNLWFCPAVFDGHGVKEVNCISTRSVVLDIDYGTAGHKRGSPFPDYNSAIDHIFAQPIQPQIAWHTGHGVQIAFLLDKIIHFADGGKAARYDKQKRKLNKMFKGDSTVSRVHLFRVPCSMNIKPDCPSVMGTLLRWEV